MSLKKRSIDRLLESLQERSKELNCLFHIEEILRENDEPVDEICPKIVRAIPPGMQHSDQCRVRLTIEGKVYQSPDFAKSEWFLEVDVVIQGVVIGALKVYYIKELPDADFGPFLHEEERLMKTIARRIGTFVMYQKMRNIVTGIEEPGAIRPSRSICEWRIVIDTIKQTDWDLYTRISRKMLHHLCWSGVEEAKRLTESYGPDSSSNDQDAIADSNTPNTRRALGYSADFSAAAFEIAGLRLNDEQILSLILKWMQEEKLSFLVQVVNRNLSLAEVADAVRRYHHLVKDDPSIPSPGRKGVQVSLIRRFLSDQLPYINIAKNYIRVKDFHQLLRNVVFSSESHGKLGGKSAGLYLATQILKKKSKQFGLLGDVRIPRTWHITSDVVLHFMHYNNFDEVVEQKYKDVNQVRLEYPHIVQSFKTALFPSDIVKGLSVALDDFEQRPLIVRSSSLLEDRIGAVFSGKYKSLFLANQGSKRQRLDALLDAIAEVYASTFSPDPIEYRAERGLLDFGEEMGIIIQEVVGNRVGNYFLPTFAGVGFSSNEFRWSPRIKRTDGLIRLVPGLGTRAVDRIGDDFPVLVAPGQPGLKVNVTAEEIAAYSPKRIDVINLETNGFETIEVDKLLREVGFEIPGIANIVSIYKDKHLSRPTGINMDFDNDDLVVTFDGLINKTPFVKQMRTILQVLEEELGQPVDIEFASDGRDFYLLQCRPQSYAVENLPATIPEGMPSKDIVFTAHRYVSNGRVPDISHVVYVDPDGYGKLPTRADLVAVGRAVGRLNKMLPRRRFILMGPGRWGSRGDIKLGVSVTYSDINNTAALIEIARKKGNYVPDLSFGTHFFQDLVEAEIRYLPLYPDDPGNVFNEDFLRGSHNILSELLPDFGYLGDTLRVIAVPDVADGRVLRLYMNAELDYAMGLLVKPEKTDDKDGMVGGVPNI